MQTALAAEMDAPAIPHKLRLSVSRPRQSMDGSFYRALMEASPMSFFDYHVACDRLCLSMPAQNGLREWRRLEGFYRSLCADSRMPAELRKSLMEAVGLYRCQPLKGTLSLCLDLHARGDYRCYLAFIQSLADPCGRVRHITGYLRDAHEERLSELRMQELLQTQKRLEERATFDAVTGLLNRATLEERVHTTLCRSQEPCYYFIFDIDNFKTVNDSAGHAEGDMVLQMIACVLRAHTRKSDLIGRIGGDEFVALLCGLPSKEAARQRAEKILAAVRTLKSPAGWQGSRGLSLSVGMAVSSPVLCSYDALYRAADRALYRAKGLGKDRCCVEPE